MLFVDCAGSDCIDCVASVGMARLRCAAAGAIVSGAARGLHAMET